MSSRAGSIFRKRIFLGGLLPPVPFGALAISRSFLLQFLLQSEMNLSCNEKLILSFAQVKINLPVAARR